MVVRFLESCPSDIEYKLFVLSERRVDDIEIPNNIKHRISYFGSRWSIFTFAKASLIFRQMGGGVIVTSSWKAVIVLLMVRALGIRPFHIAFTHRSTEAHIVDKILRRWQIRNADLNIADSEAAGDWVRGLVPAGMIKIIFPLFQVKAQCNKADEYLRICFVGRIAPVKNLVTIRQIIEGIGRKIGRLKFDLYGPNEGSMDEVEKLVSNCKNDSTLSGLEVQYCGPIQPSQIHRTVSGYHFIISCSHTEGFAMSIAEAMQVGVVPIVGKVGGPANYCNLANSILLNDYCDDNVYTTIDQVYKVWDDKIRFDRMSNAAVMTFAETSCFMAQYVKLLYNIKNSPIRKPHRTVSRH